MTSATFSAQAMLPEIPAGTPWSFALEAHYELDPTCSLSESSRVRFNPYAHDNLDSEVLYKLAEGLTIYDSTCDLTLPAGGGADYLLASRYGQQLANLGQELLRSPAARTLSALKAHYNPRGDRPTYLSLRLWALVAPDPVHHEMALYSLQLDLRAYNQSMGSGMFIPGSPNIGPNALRRDGDPIFALYVEDGEALCAELAAAIHAAAGM